MAKQLSGYITGTRDGITFYKMDGQYYLRMKSSLCGKRVKKSAAFARTMQSAGHLAEASVIASKVYQTLPRQKRRVSLYRKMTGMAKKLLQAGATKDAVVKKMECYAGRYTTSLQKRKIICTKNKERKSLPCTCNYNYSLQLLSVVKKKKKCKRCAR